MIQPVHFESKGNLIFVKPPILYVSVGDVVKFYADDANQYNVVIPNKDKFFDNDGSTIDEDVNQTTSPVTPEVNNKPVGTQKGYSVTSAGGGISEAPPKIIVVS